MRARIGMLVGSDDGCAIPSALFVEMSAGRVGFKAAVRS